MFWNKYAKFGVIFVVLWGCTPAPRYTRDNWPNSASRMDRSAEPVTPAAGAFQTGMASYYGQGDEFNGRKTASGEIFDKNALTAAHQTLPFGTKVKVTNLENGKSVLVNINDRGPFKKGRILDLSFAGAQAIGMVGTGTARVQLEIIK